MLSPPPPKQIFLFDMTRHRSHLFFRFLGTHPDVQDLWHPYLSAFLYGPESMLQHTKNEGETGHENEFAPPTGGDTYAEAEAKFLQAIKAAESEGKILVTNEHCQMVLKQQLVLAMIRNQPIHIPTSSNPTNIPDHIFASLTPIFVIRNPVFSVPSNYNVLLQVSKLRPGGEDWKMVTGAKLQRRLFDFFRERDGTPPLVVDGDDVIWRTDEVRDGLARALHLSPEGLSSVWQVTPEEKRADDPFVRYFLQTIDDSTGIEKPSEQPPDADLSEAYGRWLGKFGEDAARQLRSTVEANMPHYEYMAQFKI